MNNFQAEVGLTLTLRKLGLAESPDEDYDDCWCCGDYGGWGIDWGNDDDE